MAKFGPGISILALHFSEQMSLAHGIQLVSTSVWRNA
jgi:hypothetical protein